MRSAAPSRSSASTLASPWSPRVARRPMALAWGSFTSGASSMTTRRSAGSISLIIAFSRVVLPEEVPPAMTMVLRALTAALRKPSVSPASSRAERSTSTTPGPDQAPGANRPLCARLPSERSAMACLRTARARPPRVAGGPTICTRAPSGSDADSRGCSRLTPWWLAAAIWRAKRVRTTSVTSGALWRVRPPSTVSTHTSPGWLTNTSVTSGRDSQGASGAR